MIERKDTITKSESHTSGGRDAIVTVEKRTGTEADGLATPADAPGAANSVI